jgi:hypothetical protein
MSDCHRTTDLITPGTNTAGRSSYPGYRRFYAWRFI